MEKQSTSAPMPAPPADDVRVAYASALDDLEAMARFLDALLRTALPAKPRDIEALARAGRRLYRTGWSRAVIWPIAEVVERSATEALVAGGATYTCALEAAWQIVHQMHRAVFDPKRRGPATSFLCGLILDGPVAAPTSDVKRLAIRLDWPILVAEFREAFERYDAQELAALLRLEANRLDAGRSEPPAGLSGPILDAAEGAPAKRWYSAAWYNDATAGNLDPDLLRKAHTAGKICGRKVGARWQYELESVCKAYSDYEKVLREVDAAAPVVKPKGGEKRPKRERPRASRKPSKMGLGRR